MEYPGYMYIRPIKVFLLLSLFISTDISSHNDS